MWMEDKGRCAFLHVTLSFDMSLVASPKTSMRVLNWKNGWMDAQATYINCILSYLQWVTFPMKPQRSNWKTYLHRLVLWPVSGMFIKFSIKSVGKYVSNVISLLEETRCMCYIDRVYDVNRWYMLGSVHNYEHFRKRTNSTLGGVGQWRAFSFRKKPNSTKSTFNFVQIFYCSDFRSRANREYCGNIGYVFQVLSFQSVKVNFSGNLAK